MLEVHLDPATINSRKVLAGLELLGTPYEVTHVNYFAGAHKQSPYIELNPNGMLPAVKDGDFTLWESGAILQYAADQSAWTSIIPGTRKSAPTSIAGCCGKPRIGNRAATSFSSRTPSSR
jgi:glutathione S-transferase